MEKHLHGTWSVPCRSVITWNCQFAWQRATIWLLLLWEAKQCRLLGDKVPEAISNKWSFLPLLQNTHWGTSAPYFARFESVAQARTGRVETSYSLLHWRRVWTMQNWMRKRNLFNDGGWSVDFCNCSGRDDTQHSRTLVANWWWLNSFTIKIGPTIYRLTHIIRLDQNTNGYSLINIGPIAGRNSSWHNSNKLGFLFLNHYT